jgi:hypothetical protein
LLKNLLFALVFIAGCLVGVFAASYQYHKVVFSYFATGSQADLYKQILIASHLRLGETNEATVLLDSDIDAKIVSVSSPGYAYNTEYRDEVLRAAKTYRVLYPSDSIYADKVNGILNNYPKKDTFKCENSLCRLEQQANKQNNL